MARTNRPLFAFNRGLMSTSGLARVDIDRIGFSAEEQDNWMSGLLGEMSLRTGFEYIRSTKDNAKAFKIPFVYALSDQAQIELTAGSMRVAIDDVIITRSSVSTAITNSTFDSNITSWTDADESGCVSQWVTGGFMGLTGTGVLSAIRTQSVSIAGGDVGVEHGIRINIGRGVVSFKVGSTSGGSEYIPSATLRAGGFSFSFTPTGTFYITISSSTAYESLVDSVYIEQSGDMIIPTVWTEGDLPNIRYEQSGDVVFVACDGRKQYRIERRGTRSWGVAEYVAEDGPFRAQNITPITITPSALTGYTTLTASASIFTSGDVGSLYRITTTGQVVSSTISAENTFTDAIRVTGITTSRSFEVSITSGGTWTATLQRSVGDDLSWEDTGQTYTVNTSVVFDDGLDNQIIYYRIGIKTGGYSSGSPVMGLNYSLGSSSGIVQITSYASGTSVTGVVLEALGGTTATDQWEEGFWSPGRGYPSAVVLNEGRLWWAGKDYFFGSVSDAFDSYDDLIEGNSAPIVRSIGAGPIDRINWLISLQRLVAGAEMSEKTIRSNSLDEPLTATNFNIKSPTNRGSSPVAAVRVDDSGIFVRNNRVLQLDYDGTKLDYNVIDLTSYVPEVGEPYITRIAVQRYPDTRIHCVRSDGKVAVLVFDRNEDVKCWLTISTDGEIEDVCVQPAPNQRLEDSVYYTIKRTINGSDVRYTEKVAFQSECIGATINKQADSFISGTQSSSATISGLDHLEGEEVIVWADGKCYSPRISGVQTTYTITSGSITIADAVENYVVGLPYKARYKSTKLAYAAQGGTALLQSKRIDHLGLILKNTHNRSLRYGQSYERLYEMPLYEGGKLVDADHVWSEYDERPFEFEQEFDTDARLFLEAMAPMPCTILAAVMTMETNDRV